MEEAQILDQLTAVACDRAACVMRVHALPMDAAKYNAAIAGYDETLRLLASKLCDESRPARVTTHGISDEY